MGNEIIKLFFMIILLGIFMGFVLISASEFVEYYNYKYYQEEGYQVRFEWFEDGCEMKLNNIDGTQGWKSCNPGDEFVIENYGIKKEKSK